MTERSLPASVPGGKPKATGWLAHGGQTKPQPKIVIGMIAFAIMNVTTIVSLRGMPAQAEYGMASIFYYLFAAIVFLVPVSLVAAELAATFPKQGGVFRWIGEAFGPRWALPRFIINGRQW
nr:amino acid permease [Sphingomonas paeninsulae]